MFTKTPQTNTNKQTSKTPVDFINSMIFLNESITNTISSKGRKQCHNIQQKKKASKKELLSNNNTFKFSYFLKLSLKFLNLYLLSLK